MSAIKINSHHRLFVNIKHSRTPNIYNRKLESKIN